ncbi:MAG: MBL fold metallo-hydrolase [Kiritimatiellae bacterium]|nr:MBL fold metallo-hydrolase [Kiritimatiellia bacterium]
MHIESITVGEFQVNCFVIWEKSPSAIVVDPGADPTIIVQFLKNNHLAPSLYLFTHGHYDHVSAIGDMCNMMPAPVAMHKEDSKWTFDEANQMPPFYGRPLQPEGIIIDLVDGSERSDASLKYKVIHTPGHTPGSVCIYFSDHNALFTGDTLFAGSVGRTDLYGGNSRKLQSSLEKLAVLPDITGIYPGHGPISTILQEKKTNYFMRSLELIN